MSLLDILVRLSIFLCNKPNKYIFFAMYDLAANKDD